MQEVLDEDSGMSDWLIRDSKSGVVLHDRLMTDAALGAAPIKTEHSYSLHSDVESAPSSPHHTKVDGTHSLTYFPPSHLSSEGVRNKCIWPLIDIMSVYPRQRGKSIHSLTNHVTWVARIYIGIPPIDNEQWSSLSPGEKLKLPWNSHQI
jgi:hypothetical protein